MNYAGCHQVLVQQIDVEDNIVVTVSPVDPQVCPAGTTSLTATSTINGSTCADCNYQWAGASSQSDAVAASSTIGSASAGTYNVQVTSLAGCTSNTASSTVSSAAGSPGTCNVYYVNTYNGAAADGVTKSTPTSLLDAITKAACTNSTIKMQVGIYNLTDRVVVTSYVTIEGGYNAGFTTKSSDLTGGVNSTTIRRSNTSDSDDINGCTAFKLNTGAANFEFRNIRIELPGSPSITVHNPTTDISDYGIRMGAGCTGYQIIGCYVDAGVGSEP